MCLPPGFLKTELKLILTELIIGDRNVEDLKFNATIIQSLACFIRGTDFQDSLEQSKLVLGIFGWPDTSINQPQANLNSSSLFDSNK
jgi:hypothetical protein